VQKKSHENWLVFIVFAINFNWWDILGVFGGIRRDFIVYRVV
jgi:hypothetical protein